MISVKEAKKLIEENTQRLPVVVVPLLQSLGMTLSAPVVSDLDMPPFEQSAMDGYAFQFARSFSETPFKVLGEIPAGSESSLQIQAGQAMRIFTGAPVPEGADTVVMQEKVRVEGDQIWIDDLLLKKGGNVRSKGSQTRQGETVIKPGTTLTPAAIGLLAGLGVTELKVWAKPKICLIITGSELAAPGTELKGGQVYESNSFTLMAALQELKTQPTLVLRSPDDVVQITAHLSRGIAECDLVLVTGGISVGDYDLVKKAMDHCQVKTIFYKVKQKPGKPLFFGKHAEKPVFGLPGNPGSVLSCYYEYIEPMLLKMMGKSGQFPRTAYKILAETVTKKEGLTHFLKGKLEGEQVFPLQAQESYKMDGFALADCLIVLDEQQSTVERGAMVEVHLVNPM